jgi:regulator of protease activity HflC (stomatin/prohibitin superfamily)
MSTLVLTILVIVLIALAVAVVRWSVHTIPQASAAVVERFGRYHRTLSAGPHIVTPFVDRIRALVDLRGHVVTLQPQQVLTSDNMKVKIEPVISFRVIDPKAATYEVADYISALQNLTTTTLRRVAASMDMERVLQSRDRLTSELRTELGRAAGEWGLRVSGAELKSLEPPAAIQESIEVQRRAEHEKNAAELRAQGQAEAIVLRAMAEGAAQAVWVQGQAEGIARVFQVIAEGKPDQLQVISQILLTLNNRPPVRSPEVGPVHTDGQGLVIPPPQNSPEDRGTGLAPGPSRVQRRARSSTRPSAVTRVSKDGSRAVAGPCTTVPSAITKVDPCQGQTTQTAPRSVTIRP